MLRAALKACGRQREDTLPRILLEHGMEQYFTQRLELKFKAGMYPRDRLLKCERRASDHHPWMKAAASAASSATPAGAHAPISSCPHP